MFDLEKIEDPSFVKKLSKKELTQLASEIRKFLVDNISKTGGHLASNLGVVELTIALFYVFDAEQDKFIYDVGHQTYVHKILTGRAKEFKTLRKIDGLSGYTSRNESKYDVFESGHSSSSISAQAGFILSDDIKKGRVISIIGDSSISNGLAFEGLNFLGSKKDIAPIIILNDNKMGISRSVGALSKVFARLRGTRVWRGTKRFLTAIFPKKITNSFHQLKRGIKGLIQIDNIFEDMGFDYYGPIDGNDIKSVIRTLERVKMLGEPVVVHVLTKKGYGYSYAEEDLYGSFHGVAPFNVETGKPLTSLGKNEHSYSEIVAESLVQLRKNNEFYVVTPAMKVGAKLQKFAAEYPNDFFDVGIAEEHAATMSAGMALGNKNVVLLMYSTFAQRAYDEILNDICRSNLKIIIGIDRAGIVGEDGSTHQGIYDVAMFNSMPHIKICMARNAHEIPMLFSYALIQNSPIVIRYPRGSDFIDFNNMDFTPCDMKWDIIHNGFKAVVISYGPDLDKILKVIIENNLDVELVNARFIKPVDEESLIRIFKKNVPILIIEQVVQIGALFSNVAFFASKNNYSPNISTMGFTPDEIIHHGRIEDVLKRYKFSEDDFLERIKELYEN